MDDANLANLLLAVAIGLVCGLIGANVGQKKGYRPLPFFLLAFLCTIPGLIIAVLIPAKE